MEFIEEVVVEEFLPTVRSMLAERLREHGLTQREVADLLGISQSAVSKYAHGNVTSNERIRSDDRVVDLVDEIAAGLADSEISQVQALVELEVLIRELENGDLLAELHEERMPDLAEYEGSFLIHDPDSELRTTERTLSSLRRGLRMLERTSGFASLIPAVGSNLVACVPGAETVDDVAGVPGRIFDIKGRATVPSEPEFGVSEHVATVLLSAREGGSDAAAAINVRYNEALVDRLEELGHDTVDFDAERDPAGSVQEAIADAPAATVVYQTGGFGIEPVIYVLGPDPESVAATVRELC